MAEIYPLGQNRIFYRTSPLSNPVEVTADLLDPDLNNHVHIVLEKVVDLDESIIPGLYYFEPFFSLEGTYIAIFYEDGVEKTSQAFSTRKIPTVSEGGGFRSFRGENVINI